MNNRSIVTGSFQTRILMYVGSLFLFLMLLISMTILFQWKSMLIEDQLNNSKDLTHAFSISVLDAMIYSGNSDDWSNVNLNNLLGEFMNKTPKINSIAVVDKDCRIISHSDLSKYNQICSDKYSKMANQTQDIVQAIYQHQVQGWIIESYHPIAVKGKRWGTLIIALEAETIREQIHNLYVKMLYYTLGIAAILLLSLNFLIGRVTGSLKSLVSHVDRINLESDEFVNRPVSNDEIGYLSQRFGALETRLTHSRNKLIDAQKQVFQAEKLASIGRLASGVAHEINNPLNGIRSCLYSINRNPSDQKKNEKYFNLIGEGITHIEFIVRKLLDYAREKPYSMIENEVNAIIKKTLELLEYRLNEKKISINLDLDPNLPLLASDAHSMMEVFMNILINSMDAVNDGGSIKVISRVKGNDHIEIIIEDDGCGISKDNLESIFDPFFTTKDPGEGTGLGLAVAMSIIEAHQGKIRIESKENEGTHFYLKFPLQRQKNKEINQ